MMAMVVAMITMIKKDDVENGDYSDRDNVDNDKFLGYFYLCNFHHNGQISPCIPCTYQLQMHEFSQTFDQIHTL